MVSLRNHFYTFMILHPVWDVLTVYSVAPSIGFSVRSPHLNFFVLGVYLSTVEPRFNEPAFNMADASYWSR